MDKTIKERSETDITFLRAYTEVMLPTKKHEKLGKRRQYSKWLKRRGLAFKTNKGQ